MYGGQVTGLPALRRPGSHLIRENALLDLAYDGSDRAPGKRRARNNPDKARRIARPSTGRASGTRSVSACGCWTSGLRQPWTAFLPCLLSFSSRSRTAMPDARRRRHTDQCIRPVCPPAGESFLCRAFYPSVLAGAYEIPSGSHKRGLANGTVSIRDYPRTDIS